MSKDKIIIYTDGAAKGNPGRAGWGAVIMFVHNDKLKVESKKLKVESKYELHSLYNFGLYNFTLTTSHAM